jgi:hypothetical protein
MIHRDYIVRMTETLARTLAKILLLKEQKEFGVALDEIDRTGKELLGDNFPILKQLSDKDLIKWMFSDGYFDSAKCIFMSQLMKAEGEILELKGEVQQSRIRYLQAFHLLSETVQQDERNDKEELKKLIAWLADKTLSKVVN